VATVVLVTCMSATGFGQSEESERKGVFTGDHVGCRTKSELFDYYGAAMNKNRSVTNRMIAQCVCIALAGRTYVSLRVGFVTAQVRVTYQGADMELWVRSAAVVESPPPPRESHFNF